MVVAGIVLETVVGLFFAFSGYHKLFNRERGETLRETLIEDLPRVGLPLSAVPFMRWWVPCWELGAGVVAMVAAPLHWANAGIVAQVAMVPILAIMCAALCCEGAARVRAMHPIDWGDRLDDWLYLPETLLSVMALAALML